jgi:ABC-type multidrug transport system ATPase subunit
MAGRPRALANRWLERVGLGSVADRPVATYSLGMRRRLALARVGLLEPAVLLADEPFVGLDEEGVGLVRELVDEVRRRGGGVILATHDWDRAQPLGDRVLVLRDGRPQPQEREASAGALW